MQSLKENESFRFPLRNHILSIEIIESLQKNGGRGGQISDMPNDIRFDGIGYMRQSTTQGRCKVCQKNARTMCSKFVVRLHSDKNAVYFEMYHGT